ncbi:MAG: Ima1 N-terminal domain-containing protein [Podila humilis]|nr:MAG: Ima1 N-terminal domain-containing protein [Podila humilis]
MEIYSHYRKSHSRLSRSLSGKNTQQSEIFCEKCNGHQRVVYQLLSNYIPGEDDDSYQDYYDNADTYRRQLEERYPLACSQCLDKVQRALSKQNYKFKSNILNTALSKSRGDRISRTRTYPSTLWIIAGLSFLSSNLALLTTTVCGIFGPDSLPPLRSLDALKYPDAMAGTLDVSNIIRATTKLNILGFLPGTRSFGTLLLNPTDPELSGFVLALICLLSIAGFFWNPLLFVVQRWPQKRIKEHWYFQRSRVAYGIITAIQVVFLGSGSPLTSSGMVHSVIMLLHIFILTALFSGQSIQDPIELKLRSANVATERPGSRADTHSPKKLKQIPTLSSPRHSITRTLAQEIRSTTLSDPHHSASQNRDLAHQMRIKLIGLPGKRHLLSLDNFPLASACIVTLASLENTKIQHQARPLPQEDHNHFKNDSTRSRITSFAPGRMNPRLLPTHS